MPDSIYLGKNLIRLKVVDSTNNYSTELLKHGFVPEGTVIMADEQTQGRGQRGNEWISEPGSNLTFSLILHPTFLTLTHHFLLTQTVALGVADALKFQTEFDVKIKWPNDILVGRKKVAGMLIETQTQGNNIAKAVCGIGLNVNQKVFPGGINATSLSILAGQDLDKKALLEDICFFIEKRYLKLKAGDLAQLKSDYLANLYGYNSILNYKHREQVFSGTIKEVTPEGLLVIEGSTGERKSYDLKEITFLLQE